VKTDFTETHEKVKGLVWVQVYNTSSRKSSIKGWSQVLLQDWGGIQMKRFVTNLVASETLINESGIIP
jgi:hypothetical protein